MINSYTYQYENIKFKLIRPRGSFPPVYCSVHIVSRDVLINSSYLVKFIYYPDTV